VHSLDHERGIVVDRAMDLLVRLAPASTNALAAQLRWGPAPAEAACVLGRIGDPRTVDVLVEALGHSDGGVRAESAAALAELRDPSAVNQLVAATHDPEHSVRRQASIALEGMGTDAVITGVAELLEPMIHQAVRWALAEFDHDGETFPPPAPPPSGRPSRSHESNGGAPSGESPRSTRKAAGSSGKPPSTATGGASPAKAAEADEKAVEPIPKAGDPNEETRSTAESQPPATPDSDGGGSAPTP
jgi:HEAT repeat protein